MEKTELEKAKDLLKQVEMEAEEACVKEIQEVLERHKRRLGVVNKLEGNQLFSQIVTTSV